MKQDILLYFGDIYKTGISKIDDQHRKIFLVINDIFNACINESAIENFEEYVDFLQNYTSEHFATEEKYMKQYDYSRYWIHKEEHDNFKKTFVQYKETFDLEDLDFKYVSIIMNSFIQWIIQHINDEDKHLASFLRLKLLEKYKNYSKSNLKIINTKVLKTCINL